MAEGSDTESNETEQDKPRKKAKEDENVENFINTSS
jgi:hypothetical protein